MNYGTDTYMFDSLRTGRMATAVDLLAQACYRRLTTPRGTLDDGEEGAVYGLDVCDFVGRTSTADAAVSLPAAVEAELAKDDRIAEVLVTATITTATDGTDAIDLEVSVVPFDEAINTFQLTLAVSAVSVSVLGVTPT